MDFRPANETDLEQILDIENYEIRHNVAHFGWRERSIEDLAMSFATGYPWVVAEEKGRVLGFARCGEHRSRESYRWTVEVGIYVRPESQGRGIGRSLYQQLFQLIESAGIRTIIAGIALPNDASIRLHESFGMVHVGTFPCAGWKAGEWRDVGYWAKHIGSGSPRAL